jgi:SulP family sulfate permease
VIRATPGKPDTGALVCAPGLSNIVTALSGAGLTGSYIFSQTIFSMRAGVHMRLHRWIISCVLPCPLADGYLQALCVM